MKVLHLIDSGGLYGAEKMLLALMTEQKKAGVKSVLLSCGNTDEPEKPLETEATRLGLENIAWRMKSGFNISGMWKILAWAKDNEITHLHSHGFKFNVLIGLIPAILRKPFHWTVTVHGFIPAPLFTKAFIYQFLDKKLSPKANTLCLVSPAMAQMTDFARVRNKVVVLNGIDPKSVSARTQKKFINTTRFLFVGRLSAEKGIFNLLESFAQVIKQGATATLTLMGDGPLKADVLAKIEQHQLSEHVIMKGFVDEPAQYFHQYDALVMPSLTEGVPITLLEAMREHLPIIASKVGGIPFVLGHDYDYFITPEISEELQLTMSNFIALSQKDKQALAQRNADLFIQRFTAKAMHQAYMKIYLEDVL